MYSCKKMIYKSYGSSNWLFSVITISQCREIEEDEAIIRKHLSQKRITHVHLLTTFKKM